MPLVRSLVVAVIVLIALLATGFIGLFFFTRGDYVVPETVTHDGSLPRVVLNDFTFHAQTFGDPGNPVAIVLHGGPGGDYQSLLGLKSLSTDFFVVFYDQRGAGLSARAPEQQLTIQVALDDLDAFVGHFSDGRPVILVGHSWGAMLASAYLGYAPSKVAKAVLAEPGFFTKQEADDWQARYDTLMGSPAAYWFMLRTGFEAQHITGPDDDAQSDYIFGKVVTYFANRPDNPYHCPDRPYSAPLNRYGASASTTLLASTPSDHYEKIFSAHAGETPVPILFLAGECNSWIGADLQRKHTELFPNARLKVIPNAGHDMFWDNPKATLAAIKEFLM